MPRKQVEGPASWLSRYDQPLHRQEDMSLKNWPTIPVKVTYEHICLESQLWGVRKGPSQELIGQPASLKWQAMISEEPYLKK